MVIYYPTTERIIEFNILAVTVIKAKRADQPKVLSRAKVTEAIEECEKYEGGVYDKAVVLLSGFIRKHPFASGNRRTAFIAVKDFVVTNKKRFGIKNDPKQVRAMQGIREHYYTHEEIKEWIKNGKIKEFKDKERLKIVQEELAQFGKLIKGHERLLEAIGRM